MAYSMAADIDLRLRARQLREALPVASEAQVHALRAHVGGVQVHELRRWTLWSSGFVTKDDRLTDRGERLLVGLVATS
jgi:hypothetical protein